MPCQGDFLFLRGDTRGLGGVCVRRVRRAFASFFDAHEIRAKREASPNVKVDFALIHNKLNSLKRSKFGLNCYHNNSIQTCIVMRLVLL